jgi:hypothetical protein
MLRAVFAGKDLLRRAAERLPGFREPALIVWAKGDRVMPPEHGRSAWPGFSRMHS